MSQMCYAKAGIAAAHAAQGASRPSGRCCTSKGNPTPDWMKAQLAQKKIVQDEQRFARERDEMAALVFRHEFDEKALSKAMVNEIGRLVQCAKSAQLDDLHEKRERLRVFLTAEDEEYESEFHTLMNQRLDEDIKKRKDVLLALKRDRVEKQRLFVEQKNLEKQITNCETVRNQLSKQLLVESKCSQQLQIREREAIRAAERDVDALWLDMTRRKCAQYDAIEAQKLATQRMNSVCVQETLREQIAENAERRLAARRGGTPMCCRAGETRPDPVDDKLARRQKCVQHAAELLAQAVETRRLREQEAEQVRQLEAAIMTTCRSELAAEEEFVRRNRNTRQRETLQYLDYLNQLRCEQKASAAQLDDMIAEMNRQLQENGARSRCRIIAERRKREVAMHAARWEQIEERRSNRCKACSERFCEALIERELAQRNLNGDKDQARARLLRNMEIARELLLQVEEAARLRAEERKADEIFLIEEKKQLDACDELSEKFMRGELNVLRIHPNTKQLLDDPKMDTCKKNLINY